MFPQPSVGSSKRGPKGRWWGRLGWVGWFQFFIRRGHGSWRERWAQSRSNRAGGNRDSCCPHACLHTCCYPDPGDYTCCYDKCRFCPWTCQIWNHGGSWKLAGKTWELRVEIHHILDLLGPFTGQGAESISLAEKREQVLQKLQKFLGRVFLFTRGGGLCSSGTLYVQTGWTVECSIAFGNLQQNGIHISILCCLNMLGHSDLWPHLNQVWRLRDAKLARTANATPGGLTT